MQKILGYLLTLQQTIMVISSLLIVVGLGITVVLRYVFQTGLQGLEELIIIPAFWMYFIGAAYATQNKEHITADIVSVYIKSERIHLWLGLVVSLINFGLISIFAYWSLQFIQWSINSGARANVWDYPLYVPQSAILVGFVLMTFYTLLQVLKKINELYRYKNLA